MMNKKRSIVIIAPDFYECSPNTLYESQFHLLIRGGHLASLINLDILFNSKARLLRFDRGPRSMNPTAGYYLEGFLKMRGYDAHAIFEWEDDQVLLDAMKSDPIATDTRSSWSGCACRS